MNKEKKKLLQQCELLGLRLQKLELKQRIDNLKQSDKSKNIMGFHKHNK